MVRTKERHLLVAIEVLDAVYGSGPSYTVPLSEVHKSIRDAVHRHVNGLSGPSDADAAASSLQTKFYSPHAQAVLVRVPLVQYRRVREAVGLVKFAHKRPVKLSVARAFGNALLARRELARRLESSLRACPVTDAKGKKRIRSTLDSIEELQRR